tara:strand:- start:539 stop:1813 length:1275 start_codon:yes stop_codon:yes gene_type:complete
MRTGREDKDGGRKRMISGVLQSAWGAAQRWFPNRQIYHRSDGQVRYFEITTELQLGAILSATILTGWLCFATVSVAFHGQQIAARTAEMNRINEDSRRMVAEARAAEAAATAFVDDRIEEFDRTATEFQARHETLRRLINLAEQIGGPELTQSPTLDDGQILMAAVPADPTPRFARDPIEAISYDLNTPEGRVASLVDQQDAVLSETEDAAEARLENLRAVLRLTGLRPDDVLEEGRSGETGGPFLGISTSGAFGTSFDPDDPFSARIARIASRMIEAQEVEMAAMSLPLGEPLQVTYRETSDFGFRVDPFTGRPAFHSGQDFVAYRRAPIVATGPGRVVYAGWRSGYGRTVEIDHGYGFVTRYAHLNSIEVRRGDEVTQGQQIATMGSTGRSTATHLHYEIMFRREHHDPDRFLRAGRYVQQG